MEKKRDYGFMVMVVIVAIAAFGFGLSVDGLYQSLNRKPADAIGQYQVEKNKLPEIFPGVFMKKPVGLDPNLLLLHCRYQLVKSWQKTGNFETGWISDDNFEMKGVNPLTVSVVRGLREIDGVKSVRINPYEIYVGKSPAYSWGEILPKIVEILGKYLPEEGEEKNLKS